MTIRFLANTYIRNDPNDLTRPAIGLVFAGYVMEVEEQVYEGTPIEHNNAYFRDQNGWYYWSGGTRLIQRELTPPAGAIFQIETPEGREESIEEAETVPYIPADGEEDHNLISTSVTETDGDLQDSVVMPVDEPVEEIPTFQFPVDPALYPWALRHWQIPTVFWTKHQLSGRQVRIAVLGPGLDIAHPDLEDRVVLYRDFTTGGQTLDTSGTAYALMIAGAGDYQVAGIAPAATLIGGKVTYAGTVPEPEHLIAGIQWAIQERADIVFSSTALAEAHFSGTQKERLRELIDAAAARNTFFIAAAGDSRYLKPEDRYPAAFSSCLSVGAHDRDGQVLAASISSRTLDVLAPGEKNLFSEGDPLIFPMLDHTAIAAAHTTGLAALILEWIRINPQSNSTTDRHNLLDLLRNTAKHRVDASGRSYRYGQGLLSPIDLWKGFVGS